MAVRRMFLAALPSVSASLIFAFGFGVGWYQVTRTLRRQIADSLGSGTLGRMLANSEKGTHALAYEDPAAAAREMDHYSYAIPNVLTPFTGTGPIHADRFFYLDQSDALAGLTASDEIFLDSYHFGDRENAILARKIGDGTRQNVTLPS